MEKTLIVDAEKCGGCRVCELICSMEKFGEYNPEKSFIKILKNQELNINIPAITIACDFCGECVKWCFDEAITIVDRHEAIVTRKEVKVGKFPAPLIR